VVISATNCVESLGQWCQFEEQVCKI